MARRKQPPGAKPYRSPSQLDTICRCGEQYRRIYLEGERAPPGIDQARGTAVHACAAVNFRQKMRTGRDLKVKEFKEIAAESFDAECAGGISVGPEVGNVSVALGQTRDLVVDMAEVHAREQAPAYERPRFVEQEFRIELPGTHDALGIIDLATEDGIVADFKTSRKKKSQKDADGSTQLTMYAAGHVQLAGEMPTDLRLDTIAATSAKISRQVLSTERGPADFDALAARINAVNNAIEKGVFLPAPPEAWQCSPRWCGFFHQCVFTQGQSLRKEKKDDE